jgi:RNA polymerase sigma factor (sigma-70 family)
MTPVPESITVWASPRRAGAETSFTRVRRPATSVLDDMTTFGTDSTPSDAELITRVRGGELQAYGELFDRHRDAAHRLARQLVKPPDSDDLVAEAFTKVLSVLRGGGGPDIAFRAYLLTAIRRLHIDRMREGARVEPTDDLERLEPGATFVDPAIDDFERSAAARAFASLPERWQLVLWHLEVEGQKPSEIAPLLGLGANSVSALAYRAREGLRQAYLQMHLADSAGEQCHWTSEHLGAYVRDGLSTRDSAKVRQHLEECPRCSGLYLELSEINSNLAALLAPALLGSAATAYVAGGSALGAGGVLGWLTRVKSKISSGPGAAVAAAVAAAVVVAGVVAAMMLTGGNNGGVASSQGVVVNSDDPGGPGAVVPTSTHRGNAQPNHAAGRSGGPHGQQPTSHASIPPGSTSAATSTGSATPSAGSTTTSAGPTTSPTTNAPNTPTQNPTSPGPTQPSTTPPTNTPRTNVDVFVNTSLHPLGGAGSNADLVVDVGQNGGTVGSLSLTISLTLPSLDMTGAGWACTASNGSQTWHCTTAGNSAFGDVGGTVALQLGQPVTSTIHARHNDDPNPGNNTSTNSLP